MSDRGLVLRVDPIACDGHGLCAELFPERVTLDDWGFPVIAPEAVPAALEPRARRAERECPTCALRLVPAAGTRPAGAGTRRS
jgi:ferredoxin